MDIHRELLTILPEDRIKTSLVDRIAFAGDAGFYQLIPKAVVFPISEAEVANLFAWCKQNRIPLVFRTAGTSLSGQAITDGILADVSRFWKKATVLENGKAIKTQPGLIGGRVNGLLSGYGYKIGPDPASINAAMMGGILSNNASGMCCGVAYNAYHTLKSIRFMLPDGKVYDTGLEIDYIRFDKEQALLAEKLKSWRQEIHNNGDLLGAIRRKYRMKNTVGYGLNAFADYEHPLDIFAHLLIGAEGTLAFISEAVLHTIPDLPYKSASMLYFRNIYDACNAIAGLKEAGAEALELMDDNALKSVAHMKGLPGFFKELPVGCSALLCEFQAGSREALEKMMLQAEKLCNGFGLLHPPAFTKTEADRQFYWKVRKGMFPSVGAVRKRGTTVILEDIAFPVQDLADAILDLHQLFKKFEYENAIIFGHAKEGNIHFVITQLLDSEAEIKRYDAFMREVVDMVLQKYGGALKAEHGTGRNMAPFVEAEWGGDAYRIMEELKQTVDPVNILNPGVIINPDKQAHIKNLKHLPEVEQEVDKCIECGFCEHHCPSKDVTLTPRQRIQVRRHLESMKHSGHTKSYGELLGQYKYAGLDTCATDGLCQLDCPVDINTGELVKRLRSESHHSLANGIAKRIAQNFGLAEKMVILALKSGQFIDSIFGSKAMYGFTSIMQKLVRSMPVWWPEMPKPPKWNAGLKDAPDFIYLSACIQRMMGHDEEHGSVQDAMITVSKQVGIHLWLPEDIKGHCCGQAFSSKGYFVAAQIRQRALIDALWVWTEEGRIPVVCDFTSCTYTIMAAGKGLEKSYQDKWKAIRFMDSVQYLNQVVLPKLSNIQKKDSVVLHPGCAVTKLQLVTDMKQLATGLSHSVTIPKDAGCCGMAGDRGFLFPELTKGATKYELEESVTINADGYYASAKTCEMALTHFGGKPYRHIVYLVKEACNGINNVES